MLKSRVGWIVSVCLAGLLLAAYFRFSRSSTNRATTQSEGGKRGKNANVVDSASKAMGHAPLFPRRQNGELKVLPADVLREQCKRYLKAAKELQGARVSRFSREVALGLREARLLAQVRPEEVYSFAANLLGNSSSSHEERAFALYILGQLAKQGNAASVSALHSHASTDKGQLGRIALSRLAEADTNGSHKTLYWQRSRDGWHEALRAVSRWPDASSLSVLSEVVNANPGSEYPQSGTRILAIESREKIDLLLSSDCDSQIKSILEDSSHARRSWLRWAVEVAVGRKQAGMELSLRKRLDLIESAARMEALEIGRLSKRSTDEVNEAVTRSIEAEPDLDTCFDRHYDDILVALHTLGGDLKAHELKRLQMCGYACDPSERLSELIPPPAESR